MLHVDAVRRSAEVYSARGQSHFPDPITAAIDEERREYFEQRGALYESRFVLCVSYLPPAGAVKKLSEVIYDDDAPKQDAAAAAGKTLELFEREIRALENRLSASFRLRRLRGRTQAQEDGSEVVYDELLQHLHYCVTGIDQPIRMPDVPLYLDAVIGGQELWGGVTPRIGRNYLQVVAIEGFPAESYSGILTDLGELAFDYRWSTRYIFLDSWEALSHIERFRRKWKQQVIPFLAQLFNFKTDNINEDAALMVQDAGAAKWVSAEERYPRAITRRTSSFSGRKGNRWRRRGEQRKKRLTIAGSRRELNRSTPWTHGWGVCRGTEWRMCGGP
jgi:type IV secretory pathway VirB4 component